MKRKPSFKPYQAPSGGWGSAGSLGNILLREGVPVSGLVRVGETERVPLEQAAELYVRQHGEVGVLAELNQYLGVERVASHHKEFARVPWRRAYTTNYDEVFEMACRQQGVRIAPAIATKPLGELDPRCLDCIHLNGFLPWARVGNIDQTLILTEQSNLESKVPHSPWLRLFKDDLRASSSLSDSPAW